MYSALSLHPQYHDWGVLEQGTEPPTAPRAPQHKWLPTAPGVCLRCVCSLLWVCTLDGLNAEHKFRVWVTKLGHMSRHFKFTYYFRFHSRALTPSLNWTSNQSSPSRWRPRCWFNMLNQANCHRREPDETRRVEHTKQTSPTDAHRWPDHRLGVSRP